MFNTPGVPSVIRKRAHTPPHLKKPSSASGGSATKPQDQASKGKEEKSLETIYHASDILEFAKILDLNILRDTALLWIAEEFWLSPLPDDWDEAITVRPAVPHTSPTRLRLISNS